MFFLFFPFWLNHSDLFHWKCFCILYCIQFIDIDIDIALLSNSRKKISRAEQNSKQKLVGGLLKFSVDQNFRHNSMLTEILLTLHI